MISRLIVSFVGVSVIGHGSILSFSIAKWHGSLNSQWLVYDSDDRHHWIFWICFQKEQIRIQTHDWPVMSQYWHSYIEKPTNQIFSPICFLKESIHIYKTTRILDMNKFPPNVHNVHRLRYSGDISQALEKPGRNFTQVGEAPTQKILSHHVEFYAMYTPPLNGRSYILRLKLNLIIHFLFHSLLLPSQTHPAVFLNASIRLRTICCHRQFLSRQQPVAKRPWYGPYNTNLSYIIVI